MDLSPICSSTNGRCSGVPIKLAKRAMTAPTKDKEMTDEESMTVLTECEAMLNNRPLTYVSNDPNDLEPLRPAHFLNSKPTTLMLQHELKSEHISSKGLHYNKDQSGTRGRGASGQMMLFLS